MKGIVLKRTEFQESSVIIQVITENELVSLMVKGAKRKNSMKLSLVEPLTLIDFEKTKSNKFPSLTEGIVINNYNEIKNDLYKYYVSSCISEYVLNLKDNVLEQTEINNLYNLVIESLDRLTTEIKEKERILFEFELSLMKLLGINPNEDYVRSEYKNNDSLINSINNCLKNELIESKIELRWFIEEFYKREMNIKIKSKKLLQSLSEE